MKKIILVAGNVTEKTDATALVLVEKIKKNFPDTDFISWDPTEEFPAGISESPVLVDTVMGIRKITLYKNLDEFSLSPRNTVHDFDLPVHLGLLQKLGKIKSVTIIGIPYNARGNEAARELAAILEAI